MKLKEARRDAERPQALVYQMRGFICDPASQADEARKASLIFVIHKFIIYYV